MDKINKNAFEELLKDSTFLHNTELKNGDTVRIIGNSTGSSNRIEDVGIISNYTGSGSNFRVNVENQNYDSNWTTHEDVELVEETEKIYTIGNHVTITRIRHACSTDYADENGRETPSEMFSGVINKIHYNQYGTWLKLSNTSNYMLVEGTSKQQTIDNKIDKKYIEVQKMELKDIKKTNLKEANKKFNEEQKNAEVSYALEKLRLANNEIDRLDREIKQREFQKKPYQEIIDSFN